jgi:Flp pilus assembly protein TadG
MEPLFRRAAAKLVNDRGGGVFIYTAIVAPFLLGFAGLSVDVGIWYANQRLAQAAADSGAMAGALEVLRSSANSTAITNAANTDSANNGFSAANGDTVTVNFPPQSGAFTSNAEAVEVIISRPARSFLSQLAFEGTTTITARAVARAGANDICVWSLNPSDSGALSVSGNAQVNLGCGVLANSTDAGALTQNGSSCLNATQVKVAGNSSGACISPQPVTGVSPVADPLASMPPPGYGSCDYSSNITVNSSNPRTLSPGTYCGNIRVNANGQLTLQPGLYVLNGAGLTVAGQGSMSGTDVSFYLTENSGTPDNISIAGGANVSLTAPANGDTPGILFYQDRDAPSNVTHSFTGGSSMNLEGILYFPNQDLSYSGGASISSSPTIIIADTVTFNGNATAGGFENSSILSNPLLISAAIVE